MASDNYQIKKTGSDDNERAQINKALREIFTILERRDQWDAAASWGDHANAGYASELSEIAQFDNLGVPQDLQVLLTTRTTSNGTQENVVEVSWKRILDNTIVYDLEIRKSNIGAVSDPTDSAEILQETTQYSVPIIANDFDKDRIVYTSQFQNGQQFWFRVRIRRERLVSAWSPFVNIEIPVNLDAPDAPTNLTGEALPASAQISWDYDYEANPEVAAIQIERDGNVIDAISRPAVTFKDGVLPIGTQVTYRVRAVLFDDVAGTNVASPFSNAVNVTPIDITFGTPSVPQNLTLSSEIITNNTGGQIGRVTAEWDAIPGTNITYDLEIERRDFDTGAVLGILETPSISNPDDVQNNNPKYEWIGNINDRFAVRVRSRNATSVSGFTGYEIIDIIPDSNSPGDINPASIVLTPLYQGALIKWDIPTADNYFETKIDRRQTAPPEKATTVFQTVGRVSRPISFFFDDVGELTVDSNKVEGSITIRSDNAPSQRPDGDPLVVGDIWIDTNDNDISRSWDGNSWELTYTVRERFQYRLTPISSAGQQANSIITAEVTPSNIPDASITAAQIVARSITADRIESNTITAGEINVGSLTADSAFIGGVQQNSILNLIIRGDNQPTERPDGSALKAGDIWIDTDDGNRPYSYNGSSWIKAYTAITGGDIVTGTITANQLDISNVTAAVVDDGNLTSDTEVNVTIRADDPPSARPSGGVLREGDIWIDTNDGNRPYTYDGRTPYANAGWIQAYTIIDGGNIVTGTITANKLDVDDIEANSTILVTNSDISRLNNDAGYTDFDATDTTVTIRSASEPSALTGRPDGTALVVGDIWIDTGDGDKPYTWNGSSWDQAYTVIDGSNISTGSVQSANYQQGSVGWKIGIDGDDAEFNDVNARGSLIAGTSPNERVEITSPSSDFTYAIWIGDDVKDDNNGVFWVKHNGQAKIDKATFDITDSQVVTGAFSNANTATGTTTGNTLTARSNSLITVGSGGIKLDVNYFYLAGRSQGGVTEQEYAQSTSGDISGSIEVLRGTTATLTGSEVQVNNISFSSPANRTYYATTEGGLSPGVITISNNTDFIRAYTDNPTPGNYYYWVRFSTWNPNGFTSVTTNTFYVTWVTGA